MNRRSFYSRFGWAIVVVCLLLLPLTVWGAIKALQSTTNEARDWLPRHYPETVEYEWFSRHFGSDDFVLVTWEGCTLEDPRLAQLTAAVEKDIGQQDSADEPLFSRLITGPSMLDELTEPSMRLRQAQAIARLRGSLIGPDNEQTCAIVHLAASATFATRLNLYGAWRSPAACPPLHCGWGGCRSSTKRSTWPELKHCIARPRWPVLSDC